MLNWVFFLCMHRKKWGLNCYLHSRGGTADDFFCNTDQILVLPASIFEWSLPNLNVATLLLLQMQHTYLLHVRVLR